ncbi:zinc-dependent metalloprotease [Telluribacter sp. SYSU D00476]|uniref:zinc-dependent metalloprotease n=1 Tax=Telluribacter sp. SYSU D00476 TaxID=2811430 RepID=UPI001FF5A621|nr:zinc-dependent metalloprotease [Telluribacter sp. SYSU D00476]
MSTLFRTGVCIATLAACVVTVPLTGAHAQARKEKKKEEKEAAPAATADKKEAPPKKLADVIKKCKEYPGLFTMYQDTTNGTAYLLVRNDQVDKEYIYFNHVTDGVLDAGYFRGAYGDNGVFSIRRYFDRMELIGENTSFYFDKDNALKRAEGANINRPIIASQKIEAQNDEKTAFLIKADDIFLGEVLGQIKPSPNPNSKPGQSFDLGKLSKEKTKTSAIRNYPENTDIVVEYAFENPYPVKYGSSAVTDSRNVVVKVQHSLIQMPQNDYQPRRDDPRIGYFSDKVTDMTSPEVTPYRDLIHRWHLVKKDPTAALSEPVEPIVWWIENTTPLELRPTIKAATLQWNKAFEKAGFKNAVVVKEQPDDATWDAGDMRYNVLRWTSSPIPPFGGYGPSFVNPRTGQILGADIMLEYVFVTNRLQSGKVFNSAALGLEEAEVQQMGNRHFCTLGSTLHQNNLFGMQMMDALGGSGIEVEKDEMLKQSLYFLVLHEVGHTLGLNHNMKASQMIHHKDIHDRTRAEQAGLTGSVMDYPAVNYSLDRTKQGYYYTTQPGPYDLWVIEYGYAPVDEAQLRRILARSTEPALMFGNDADDMRAPGKGIDPRVMINDMSGDAIGYAVDRVELVKKAYPTLRKKLITSDQSFHELRNAYLVLTGEQANSLRIISRYIGGIYVDRAYNNQTGATQPFTPVPASEQKRAMKALAQLGFAPDAFNVPDGIYAYLQTQRRGFDHFGSNEDPQIHGRVLMIHQDLLNQLMHKNVWERITNTQLYGNGYNLNSFASDLTEAIFKADMNKSVNTMRQNLQQEYVDRLAGIMQGKEYDHVARTTAFGQLKAIQTMLATAKTDDAATRTHRDYLKYKIETALETKKS